MEIGLVDALGGLYDAIDNAAQLASLDNPKTRLFGTPISPEQLILEQLGREFGAVHIPGFSTLQRYAQQVAPALTFIDSLKDPRNTYVRCLDCLIDF